MIHLSIMFYILQLLLDFLHFRQIFADLKNFMLSELTWFANTDGSLEDMASKIRGATSSKHINSDLLAVLTICGLLFALAVVSVTCSNEEINYASNDTDTIVMDVEDDPSYPFSGQSSGLTNYRNVNEEPRISGSIFRKSPSSERDFLPAHDYLQSSEIQVLMSPNSQLNADISQHSQKTQTSERFLQKSENSHEWMTRCTRSGHVYGKYPL